MDLRDILLLIKMVKFLILMLLPQILMKERQIELLAGKTGLTLGDKGYLAREIAGQCA
ncbi:hypothetical protein SAMN02583745_02738 [Thorsellia anophelis DSM 18579]|uniref:Transposase n=1 Tax=Thorsellia anophelis DSM 18579 TaxID=1123402 RepID=A0A1I0FEN9_9GAMM|nr:hypothetical protein SAMN02583745_02738 [Thorsellia anophelis DSM 18579]